MSHPIATWSPGFRLSLACLKSVFTVEHVDETLNVAREALALLAELAVKGQRARGEAFVRAQAEHDALVCLLDEAPQSEQEIFTTAAAVRNDDGFTTRCSPRPRP
jgi:hypothetical protein